MIKIKYSIELLCIPATFTSCIDDPKLIQENTDGFSPHTASWPRSQINNSSSYGIVNYQFLVDTKRNKEHKLIGKNMFNTAPNYFKMGLYGNYKSNDPISIHFDDFQHKLYEK